MPCMAMHKMEEAKVRMHLYVQTMAEAVNPASEVFTCQHKGLRQDQTVRRTYDLRMPKRVEANSRLAVNGMVQGRETADPPPPFYGV